jgi:hypothetical protein
MVAASCDRHAREASNLITAVLIGMQDREHLLIELCNKWASVDPTTRRDQVFISPIEFLNVDE